MAKKRDRLQVIGDILRIIREQNNSIKPTPLLRYSNLSFQRFTEYIEELLEKELVLELIDNKKKKYYTLTTKGFKYLEKHEVISKFISEFNLEFDL